MTAKEFLVSKGVKEPDVPTAIISFRTKNGGVMEFDLVDLLDEYLTVAGDKKIDVSKEFTNLTDVYEKSKEAGEVKHPLHGK